MTADSKPELLIFEHGDSKGICSRQLLEGGRLALTRCLQATVVHPGVLADLHEVEVNLVSDEVIAGVHNEFMGDGTATDVITFHHGEIFISVDTAEREGGRFGHGIQKEALLSLIHGLLHLNGHEDKEPDERATMKEVQEGILEEVWR